MDLINHFWYLIHVEQQKEIVIWPSDFRGEDLLKLANQKQELHVVAICLLMDRDKMSNL
jgi:hypothetical protein